MPKVSVSKLVKVDNEAMVLSTLQKEMERSGKVKSFDVKNGKNVFVFQNKEVLKVKGTVTVAASGSSKNQFVEIDAETKSVRGTLWWALMLLCLFLSGGLAIGYLIYHLVSFPSTSKILERTDSLLNNWVNNAANKCEAMAD